MHDDMSTPIRTASKFKSRVTTAAVLGVTAAVFAPTPAFAGWNSTSDGGWTIRRQICEWAPFWC